MALLNEVMYANGYFMKTKYRHLKQVADNDFTINISDLDRVVLYFCENAYQEQIKEKANG
ncbi:hypothetical protein BKP35_12180 [Anaerobacillus arseniciselenatis]|uniref:Uncharacterized protein n=1 Tax=Anaerobacillus arseniciselenatis TaxID=85682 RepID=A0A1S2LGQ7_9BACI|nr:hypothetical protein [Anaerobacillus arseniciselenatis]OIJ11494.1 hypothetical protein BKP35_12180 [Anaerobacillus arseniciselenatis]